ncbi:aminoglycoside phosphotransferase family protein [Streptomyces sp. NPDC007088]|uniref:aminoglycoside phosphotransferase family protein n=1 Tax=Streptomyces sp. NPDC007088 TaxID=3364773 RepID=UPI0036CABEB0
MSDIPVPPRPSGGGGAPTPSGGPVPVPFEVPAALVESQIRYEKEAGRAFVGQLPSRAAHFLDRWDLRPDGTPLHGAAALVLPVRKADGTPAVLKLQLRTEENEGEGAALRAWEGRGAVRLLAEDPGTATLLLERLEAGQDLDSVPDALRASVRIAELLRLLHSVRAPAGLRTLATVGSAMLDALPRALPRVADPVARDLLADCGAALRGVLPEPGDRLLHWDLHFQNVLASGRAPWLAIDPKPLAGDPGFDLLPALHNRYDAGQTARRFDAMTEVLGLDRRRAAAWTLARVLQNCLWEIEDGRPLPARQGEIGALLRARAG